MIETREYTSHDFEEGKCTCCGDFSEQIVIGKGMCVDCVEEIRFFEETTRGL